MSNKIETKMSGVTAVQMRENAWFGGLSKRQGLLFEDQIQLWKDVDWYQTACISGLGA